MNAIKRLVNGYFINVRLIRIYARFNGAKFFGEIVIMGWCEL
jgi:hypothetical protein